MGERPERVRGRVRRVAATSLILLLFVLVLPQVAHAAPSIALSPDKGPVGTEITIDGQGFAPQQPVTLLWDHLVLVDAVTPDESGSFTAYVTVPPTTGGPHQVAAEAVLDRASARFIVQGTNTTTTSTTSSTSTTASPPTTTIRSSSTTTTSMPTRTTSTSAPSTTSTTTRNDASTTTTIGTDTTTMDTDTTDTTPPTPPADDPNIDSTSETSIPGTPPSTTESTTSPDSPTTMALPESDGPTPTTAAPSTPELTSNLVNSALWGLGSEEGAPDLSGMATVVENLSVTPDAAPAGTTVSLALNFQEAVPGLSSVQIMMDEVTMGEPVPVNGLSLTIRRQVPDLPPGGHQITVVDHRGVLARSDFSILEPESNSHTLILLGLGGLVIGLGWQALRRLQGATLPSSVGGLWDDLYARFRLGRGQQR